MADLKLARKDIVRSTLLSFKLKNQELDHRDPDEYLTRSDIVSTYCVDESVMVDSEGILYTNDRYVPLSLIIGRYPFTISKANVDFSTANVSSDTFDINFLTSFNTWTASSNQSWLVLNNTSGNGTTSNITMTTDVNESLSPRSATITITATQYENMSISINVTQAANTNYSTLTVSSSKTDFSHSGGSATLSASENVYWNFSNKLIRTNSVTSSTTFSSSNSSQFSVSGNSLSVRYNDYRYSRSATITGTWNGKSSTVSLYQSLSPVRLEGVPSSTLYFSTNGETKSFYLSSNTSWQITGMPVGCSVDKTSGSNDATIYITYSAKTDEGDRSGTITVTPEYSSYLKKEFGVYQYGRTLSISPSSLSFGSGGGDKALSVSCNSSWGVSISGSGFSTNSQSSSGININASNNTGSARYGSVTVSSGSLSRTCSLSQEAGYYLNTGTSRIYLTHNSGSVADSISTNIPYGDLSISSNATDSWCRPYLDGAGGYSLNYDQNTGTTAIGYRDCTITIRGYGETTTVYVRQDNPPITTKYVKFNASIGTPPTPGDPLYYPMKGTFRIFANMGGYDSKSMYTSITITDDGSGPDALAGGGGGIIITINATEILGQFGGQRIKLTINCDVFYDKIGKRAADKIGSANMFTPTTAEGSYWEAYFDIPSGNGSVVNLGNVSFIRYYL